MYSHSFDPVAAIEYEEAYRWYLERSSVAADNFVVAVEDAVKAICTHPRRYRNTYKDLREVLLKRYPFSLVFLIHEASNHIAVVSVYHHNRNPEYKYP